MSPPANRVIGNQQSYNLFIYDLVIDEHSIDEVYLNKDMFGVGIKKFGFLVVVNQLIQL